jgi:hypothetical protein
MTMTRRHPLLGMYDMGIFIGLWDFALYPSVLLLFHEDLLLVSTNSQGWLFL